MCYSRAEILEKIPMVVGLILILRSYSNKSNK
jgi:hypothetical protein